MTITPSDARDPATESKPEQRPVLSGVHLSVVATPIGNLQDLSPRAAAVLAAADLIAAEDTRRTLKLLNHLQLKKKMISYHAHNWRSRGPVLIEKMNEGQHIALVTDAGMPAISDPGTELVDGCIKAGLTVEVIPGPCAAVTALAGSGLDSRRFVFEGFLPASGKERTARLTVLATETRTMVLYEAPHRLMQTLSDLAANNLGDRSLTLARELTKRHETYQRLTVDQAIQQLRAEAARGEYVLVLEGTDAYEQRRPAAERRMDQEQLMAAALDDLLELTREGLPLKRAVRMIADQTGLRRNALYQAALDTDRQKSGSDRQNRSERPDVASPDIRQ